MTIVDNFYNVISSFSPWYILREISFRNDYFVKAEMHDSLHSFRAHNLTFPSSFVVIDWALITSQEFPCVEFLCSSTKRGHALRSRTRTSLLIMRICGILCSRRNSLAIMKPLYSPGSLFDILSCAFKAPTNAAVPQL